MDRKKLNRDQIDKLSNKIIELAIKVHETLGPGFLESVYQAVLAYERIKLDIGFRCDFLIEENTIVEIKAVKKLTDIDTAQVINYLKVTDLRLALLFNFNVKLLKDGTHRYVNKF